MKNIFLFIICNLFFGFAYAKQIKEDLACSYVTKSIHFKDTPFAFDKIEKFHDSFVLKSSKEGLKDLVVKCNEDLEDHPEVLSNVVFQNYYSAKKNHSLVKDGWLLAQEATPDEIKAKAKGNESFFTAMGLVFLMYRNPKEMNPESLRNDVTITYPWENPVRTKITVSPKTNRFIISDPHNPSKQFEVSCFEGDVTFKSIIAGVEKTLMVEMDPQDKVDPAIKCPSDISIDFMTGEIDHVMTDSGMKRLQEGGGVR